MAIVLYAAIRVIPIYLNHMKVASAVEQVAAETDAAGVNPAAVRAAISRRFDIESVYEPTMDAISVRREGDGWVIEASYERTAPLFGGIVLLVAFNKSETIQ
jgi:hypothetical protein